MFRTHTTQTSTGFAVNIALQIFHASVRNVRQKHRSPILSPVSKMMQSAMFVLALFTLLSSTRIERIRNLRWFCDLNNDRHFPLNDPYKGSRRRWGSRGADRPNDAACTNEHSHNHYFCSAEFSLYANSINVYDSIDLLSDFISFYHW